MRNNVILDKAFDFSVRIVNLKKFLNKEKQEHIMANQLLRSGTSIGANVTEADQAQSKADFISKTRRLTKRNIGFGYCTKQTI